MPRALSGHLPLRGDVEGGRRFLKNPLLLCEVASLLYEAATQGVEESLRPSFAHRSWASRRREHEPRFNPIVSHRFQTQLLQKYGVKIVRFASCCQEEKSAKTGEVNSLIANNLCCNLFRCFFGFFSLAQDIRRVCRETVPCVAYRRMVGLP